MTCRRWAGVKMNMRLGIDVPDTFRTLRKDDILRTVKIMCELKDGRGQIDDIDNLGNRRVRSVGELMEKPVSRGPAADGAGDPRADGLGGYRHGDAARPDQRQAGGGGGTGVLWLEPS